MEAYSEEEGKDYKEAGAQVEVEKPGWPTHNSIVIFFAATYQENQTLWAGGREETEGTDDPVLAPVF